MMIRRLVGGILFAFMAALFAYEAPAYFLNSRPLSPNGSVLNGGVPGSLLTAGGTWTFGPQNPDGNWDIVLNGVAQSPNGISAIQLYILNGGTLYQLTAPGLWYQWIGAGPWAGPVSDPRPVSQTISSINLSNSTFTPATANAVVGTVSVTMSPASPAFSGTLSLNPPNGGSGLFHLVGNQLQAAGGGGTAAGTYNDVSIVATQAGISNSPQQISPSLVGGGGGGAVAAVTLTNGPPNIPNAAPGSCAAGSCAWIQAGVTNEAVSDVYADLSPISSNYGGTFSISDTTHFAISTSSDGTRNVGHITTNGSLTTGDYPLTVTATGASGSNSQTVTVHAVSGTAVACGTSTTIQNAINAAGANSTLLLADNCTYQLTSTITPQSGDVLIGGGRGRTILDGQNTDIGLGISANITAANPPNPGIINNVTLANLTLQHEGTPQSFPQEPVTNFQFGSHVGDGWVLRNSDFSHNAVIALSVHGGGFSILNNTINTNGAYSILGSVGDLNSRADVTIAGNEIAGNNTVPYDTCDGSQFKMLGINTVQVNITNNYLHDNIGPGFWEDSYNGMTYTISNNTAVNNGNGGIELEDTTGTYDIHHNVMIGNGNGNVASGFYLCGTTSIPAQPWADLWIHGARNNVAGHDNFISTSLGTSSGYADQALLFNGGDGRAPDVNNVNITNNTVVFGTTSTTSVWGYFDTPSLSHTNTSSNGNKFHVPGGSVGDTHFAWFPDNGSLKSFAQFQASPDSQESTGTIDTNNVATTGCRHVACSGSGIGAGGVPN